MFGRDGKSVLVNENLNFIFQIRTLFSSLVNCFPVVICYDVTEPFIYPSAPDEEIEVLKFCDFWIDVMRET